MPTVVLKLFAGQGTGWTDGQSSDYMLSPLGVQKMALGAAVEILVNRLLLP